jgi:signal transduction histidine kinase
LYTLERKAGDAQDLSDVVRTLLERIGATVSGTLVQIALVTPRRGMVVHRLMHGSPGIDVRVFDQLVGLSGQVITAAQPIDVCELDADEAARLAIAEQLPFAPDVGVFLPLVARDTVVGALAVVEKPGRMQCLTEDDSKLMTLVSGQVARAIAQRQARDQAEREDRLESVGRALTGIMHDFRTPMTVASGYVQMFKYAEDPSERTELADKVLAQLGRIQQMSKEVTAFARGEQTMLVRKVMVADFAREAEELIGQIFHDPALPVVPVRVSLDCRFKGVARFDAFKLLRVVQNIARNARDALADRTDGRFDVVIDAESEQLVLTFVDNGTGVPLAFRHRLFDPFATQGKKDGTGLGLAMVKQFAEAHGGGVAYRDTPGGGATFEIRIARETP